MILKEESKCPFQANHKGQPTKEQNLRKKKKKGESYTSFIERYQLDNSTSDYQDLFIFEEMYSN